MNAWTDDYLSSIVKAYNDNDQNQTKAAKELGLKRTTFQAQLAAASGRNLNGDYSGGDLPVGQSIERATVHYKDGKRTNEWVKIKTDKNLVDIIDAMTSHFEGYKGGAKLIPAPKEVIKNRMTVYNIADQHLGLYAWKPEAGANWDLSLGIESLRTATAELVSSAAPTEDAVILNLGDFFHADNASNRTERSGNALDVDGRYAKILEAGVQLMIDCVSLALRKHKRVTVRCLPGNHDPHSSVALAIGIKMFFSKNKRVTVDMDPSPFFVLKYGKALVTAAHGDKVKPGDMSGFVAAQFPKLWGDTLYRYAYFGHVHHKSKGGEAGGMLWETFQTLSAKDSWHFGMGYSSGRSMTSITLSKDRGEIGRNIVPLMEAA